MEEEESNDVEIGWNLDKESIIMEEMVEEKWSPHYREYTENERRLLASKCIQEGIMVAFKNHMY